MALIATLPAVGGIAIAGAMDAVTTLRGRALIDGGRRFARAPGWLARLIAPGFARVIDRIDAALESGAIHA